MGVAGALAWGIVGCVFLVAAGFAAAHAPGACIDANLLVWTGLAAVVFSFAALSLTFLTIPIAALGIVVGVILLLAGAIAVLAVSAGCSLQFFAYPIAIP